MQAKFKIKAIDLRGKVFHLTKSFDAPDFQPIPAKKWEGLELPETSIEEQLMDWMDNQDKWQFMVDNDIAVILDYWLPQPKKKKVTFEQLIRAIQWKSEEQLINVLATYSKMKSVLTGIAPVKQVEIVLSALGIAYMAQGYAYERINMILKGQDPDNVQNYLQ